MNRALYVAKTGLEAQNTRLATISNNLANANTTGYKQGRAEFEDLIYQNVRQPGGYTNQQTTLPSGLQLGVGTRVVAIQKMHQQGNLQNTGNELDLALQGKGFFQIQQPDGTIGYTRDGSFQLNQNGDVVTSGGLLLQPQITVPQNATAVTVGTDGSVFATIPGQAAPQQLGQLEIATFINPAGLNAKGDNLFTETIASGAPVVGVAGTDGVGTIIQSFLEASNVNTVEELIGMIEAQRTYEMNAKAIKAADGMMQYLNNNV
jgi:flagellar basal-body rod protein FlgG